MQQTAHPIKQHRVDDQHEQTKGENEQWQRQNHHHGADKSVEDRQQKRSQEETMRTVDRNPWNNIGGQNDGQTGNEQTFKK